MPARGHFDPEEDIERTVVDPPTFSSELPGALSGELSGEPFDEVTEAEPATRKP